MSSASVTIERETEDDIVEFEVEFTVSRTYRGASAGWYCPPEAPEFEIEGPEVPDGFTLTPEELAWAKDKAEEECWLMHQKGEFDARDD